VWRTEKHDFFSLPLYVRRGAVLVQGIRSNTVEYDFHTEVEAVGYGLRPGEVAVTQVVAADGSVKTFEVTGAQVA
jgi:alpha-D-xyloside xylohydrolase